MSTLELFLAVSLLVNGAVTLALLSLLHVQSRLLQHYMHVLASLTTHADLQSRMTSDSARISAARAFLGSAAFGGSRPTEQEMKEAAEKAEADQSPEQDGGVRIQALF